MARNVALIVFAVWGAFLAGWTVAGWERDSTDLVIERAASASAEKNRIAVQAISSASGKKLETQLEELRDVIPASIRTEVVKPVFTNVCVSSDFIRMYNEAIDKAERTLSGKPENKMPR